MVNYLKLGVREIKYDSFKRPHQDFHNILAGMLLVEGVFPKRMT